VSTWRDSMIGSRGWYDLVMAVLLCLVLFAIGFYFEWLASDL
jgi:hypothetical protein